MIRNFTWRDLDKKKKKKVQLVNWETITSLKEHGGLDLKTTHGMNLAFMAKVGWRLIVENQSLWAQVLTCKYIKGDIDITKLTNKPASSNLWKGVASAADILLKGTRRRIYNGLDTLF